MPTFKVYNAKSPGKEPITRVEALTIKEHGGEEWQLSTPAKASETSGYLAALKRVSRRISAPVQEASETAEHHPSKEKAEEVP